MSSGNKSSSLGRFALKFPFRCCNISKIELILDGCVRGLQLLWLPKLSTQKANRNNETLSLYLCNVERGHCSWLCCNKSEYLATLQWANHSGAKFVVFVAPGLGFSCVRVLRTYLLIVSCQPSLATVLWWLFRIILQFYNNIERELGRQGDRQPGSRRAFELGNYGVREP